MKDQEFIVKDNVALIPITSTSAFAIIDLEDVDKVKQHNTYFHYTGRDNDYVICWSRTLKRNIYLSEIIAGPNQDHIDTNKLNNRKSNLRPATNDENIKNRNKFIGNYTSKYKGVTECKRRKKKWQAQIQVDNKYIYLGRFLTQEEAAIAYNEAAIIHHGEFANLNPI